MPIRATAREEAALEVCRINLDKADAHPDYVGSGKFAVGPEVNPSRGKCYVASAALCEFLGGPKGGYHLAKATNHLGDHYWVVNDDKVILDPTKEQFDIIGEAPPYGDGRRVSRRNTLKRHLPLLEAMRAELEIEEKKLSRTSAGSSDRAPLAGLKPPVERGALIGSVVKRESQLADDQHAKLMQAWRSLVADWAERPDEFISSWFPKGALAVYFVRALLFGDDIPRTATMAYTPDRFYVAGSAYPFNEMFEAALRQDNVLSGIRFSMGGEVSFHKLVARNLPISGYRMPFDFPIGLARELIDRYCPAGGVVLDPCHGWGGRLVGFMLSHASRYVGIDPAPHSYKLGEMFDDLSEYLFEPKSLKLINRPFEDVLLSDEAYDFALTSPPYFNTEKYEGEQSSWRRYSTLDAWMDGFYRPLVEGVAHALKPGAAFVLQVTPKFRMGEKAKEIGEQVGLEYEGIYDTKMRRYNSVTADRAGSGEQFEVFVVLRKKA